jgi:hypothetical protein
MADAQITRADLDRMWGMLGEMSKDIRGIAVSMESKVNRDDVEHMMETHIKCCPHGNRLGKLIALCAGTAVSSSSVTLAIAKIIGM